MNYFAMVAFAAAQPAAPNLFTSFLPILAIFAVFYFLLVRPQQKQHKAHQQMVNALAAGDEVVTNGGLLGKVTNVGEQFLTIKIADGIEIKVQRHHIARILPKGTFKNA